MIRHQNLTKGDFLKVNCHVKYETVSVNFLYLVIIITLLVYLIFWMDLLSINGFITTCIDHVKNSSLIYVNLSNFDKFHYTISKKSYLLNTNTYHTRKVIKMGKKSSS